ncbi:MAG: insulinase family protein [Nitrospirae bacterium]|nr:insulinase family protein [Nitrospirota bacterium]MBF0535628.1 insulinase family protein [Nitrospirota bacterium]MBF0616934.1 insulinase family protein [Nitrospirota bacterium]
MKVIHKLNKSNPCNKFFIFITLLLLILTLFACTGLEENREKSGYIKDTESLDNTKAYTLSNGLKLIIIEDHRSPIATFQVWYRVGSRNEKPGKTGISHFLEHMMFKGTKNYGSKVFSNLIQKNGGTDNAFTTKNYTMYYQTVASDRIDISVEMEADRMSNLLVREEDVNSERKVVMEERRLRTDDDPQDLLLEKLNAKAFTRHPYGNPVIGWMKEIENISRDELYRYYKTYYSPDNAVVIIAGDVNSDKIMEKINRYFGKIKRGPAKEPVAVTEPPQTEEKRLTLKKQAKLPYLVMAYHVPSVPDKDSYAVDVLTIALSGKSGRLYRDLVKEQRIAFNAFASYSGLYIDPYLFYVGGTTKNIGDVDKFEKALDMELEKLKEEPLSERELQKAKNMVESTFIMGQDSIFFQAEILGMYEMLGNRRLKDEYLKEISKVTALDVMRVAKKYLVPTNRTVGVLIPE